MSQTLTDRVKAILNTPGTGENVLISELNAAFSKFDNNFIPACKMYLNTTSNPQTLTHNVTSVHDFSNTDYDTYAARAEGAMADLANNKIIIRETGIYMLAFGSGWASNATGVRRLSLKKNGTNMAHVEGPAVTSFVTAYGLAVPELCAVNDEFTLETIQTSGGGLLVSNGTYAEACFLSATWMGNAVEV